MDNFFNYGDAANNHPDQQGRPASNNQGAGGLNLMENDFPTDETSFLSLQHFVDGLTSSSNSPNTHEGVRGSNDNFNDFSHWIDGAKIPARPCGYCQSKGLQCLVIQGNTAQVVSCTSCHALARSCSLSQGPSDQAEGSATFDHNIPRASSSLRAPLVFNETTEAYDGDSGTSKIGARFPRESVRVLKNWLMAHHQHPYPTDEEKEQLKRQTGLNKTQITNWLANARRRGKVRAPIPKSPVTGSQAMDIPGSNTRISEHMPLERWKNSPPESEPASVSAIATAVRTTLKSEADSPYSYVPTDETTLLNRASSASSIDTSQSSGHSFASAFSHQSRNLQGSLGAAFDKRGRRRRRRQAPRPADSGSTSGPRQFQCTFCSESFRTKHDWQRHEKSLHLSLERWVCSATGGTCVNREKRHVACVFCGLPKPNAAHLETHNYSSCLERDLEERTFYRKDHLRQHLRLVHACKFNSWSMEPWRATIPEIKSTCGFCGIRMTTWQKRADHLAEHFKSGKSMADWRGDWGFEKHISYLVESATFPNITHPTRNNQVPTRTSSSMREVARQNNTPNSYDLVKIGLIEYIHARAAFGHIPSNTELHYESVRLIFGTPSSPKSLSDIKQSWFHDLILFSDNEQWLEPLRRFSGGSQQLGSQDQLEIQLLDYIRAQQVLGIYPSTSDLQAEACRILTNVEAAATIPCESAATWFRYLVKESQIWLDKFKIRAGLQLQANPNENLYDYPQNTGVNNFASKLDSLESQLGAYVNLQTSLGVLPTDSDLRTQARIIVFGSTDPSNKTAADLDDWLQRFKSYHGIATPMPIFSSTYWLPTTSQTFSPSIPIPTWQRQPAAFNSPGTSSHSTGSYIPSPSPTNFPAPFNTQELAIQHNLEQALGHYVETSMAPNNPKRHIPSDDDLRTRARWIMYNNTSDPYNQPTPADNPDWLMTFKQSRHLYNQKEVQDLPSPSSNVSIPSFYRTPSSTSIRGRGGRSEALESRSSASISQRNSPPFTSSPGHGQQRRQVFNTPELDASLNQYVKNSLAQGIKPSNAELRRVGRMIMDEETTAVDDSILLGTFRSGWGIGSGED